MGALKRQHHELLVREYIRNGGFGAEAYRTVAKIYPGKPLKHPVSPAVCASRILSYPEVKARYRELQNQMAKRADITMDKILSDYQEALNLAKVQEKPEAIVNAATAQAKLVGLLRDRVETGQVGEFGDMESINEVIEAVRDQVSPEAANALAIAFGLSDITEGSKTVLTVSEGECEGNEADLVDARPASDAVN
jgi:hypothetical protein